ncbi:hypothetical protein CEV08_05175 [Bartonella tribocorum]|uniref:Uncharacterized protein n=1 Tax=Bartonella tribocorum TaxID=85701 RepID=A0A2M6UUQ4_9HYPH|nr:hypothetical protein CEV08_05175 [Bartonella tribocorum]
MMRRIYAIVCFLAWRGMWRKEKEWRMDREEEKILRMEGKAERRRGYVDSRSGRMERMSTDSFGWCVQEA